LMLRRRRLLVLSRLAPVRLLLLLGVLVALGILLLLVRLLLILLRWRSAIVVCREDDKVSSSQL
jgi:hypothetical protein